MNRYVSTCGLVASLLVAGCGTDEPGTPIQLGMVTSQTGVLQSVGQSFQRIAQLAVDNINKKGGIDGQPLELVVKDDATDASLTTTRFQELIDAGAVGAVGPITSGETNAVYPLGRDQQFPFMSPSATAPSLSSVDDGGFMFRDVANDSVQGLAMTYYMTSVASPKITHATIAFENTTYGNGLADAFQAAFEKAGGTVDGRVTFEQGGPSGAPAAATQVMDDLAAQSTRPSLVVLAALDQDAAAILNVWDQRPDWSDLKWFFSDSVRSTAFLAAMPARVVGSLGTAPTFPTLGDAYSVLEEAYRAKYPDMAIDQEPYAPNVWDAVYLFASALESQHADGVPYGGSDLRDRITAVSRAPGLILHAGQWRDIIGTLRRGNDVDYDGASGPCDLDTNGEAIGPYEVWQVATDPSTTYKFDQALFLDAKQIAHLQAQ
jgi:ABC-type branched-subunit amino acid transport system substrate-binding protein